jgi:hypothetical protein
MKTNREYKPIICVHLSCTHDPDSPSGRPSAVALFFSFVYFVLFVVPSCFALEPSIPADKRWIERGDLWQYYGGIAERCAATASGLPSMQNTNWIWGESFIGIYNMVFGLDYYLTGQIGNFLSVTNLSEGFFDGHAAMPSNWTAKTMHDYLAANYVNTDGTAGVGIYTNDTWYWTQSWQTSAWSVCLGRITYAVTNSYTTHDTTYFQCGWQYQPGERLVKRYPTRVGEDNEVFDVPQNWGTYRGNVFDYADFAKMSNIVRVTTGTTNWTTLSTGITLTAVGHTNYYLPYPPDVTTLAPPITNTVDLSASPTGTVAIFATTVYALGDLSSWSPLTFQPGLEITNTATVTNFTGTNHVGDSIEVRLCIGGRLYASHENDYLLSPLLTTHVSREMLNERLAILNLLRVMDSDTAGGWQRAQTWNVRDSTNNVASGQGYITNDFSLAKSFAETIYATNTCTLTNETEGTYGNHLHPQSYSVASQDGLEIGGLFDVGVYGSWGYLRCPYLAAFSYTNTSARNDFYCFAQPASRNWHGYGVTTTWDDNGDSLRETNWTFVSSATVPVACTNDTFSDKVGGAPPALPAWCAEPVPTGFAGRGYEVTGTKILTYWDFQYATQAF